MRYAKSRFSILGGGGGGGGGNLGRHSFTINFVLAVFLREVPIRTYVVSNTTN